MNNEIIIPKPVNLEAFEPQYHFSSYLCRMVDKPDWIIEALEKQSFSPRYSIEQYETLELFGHHDLGIPMVCFCDSLHEKLPMHAKTYGNFGIKLTKAWGLTAGLQPVHYLNPNSPLVRDFREAFGFAREMKEDSPLRDYLVSQLVYMKPLLADKEKRFYEDECEWRYIPPNLPEDFQLIIRSMNEGKRNTYNDALKSIPGVSLVWEL